MNGWRFGRKGEKSWGREGKRVGGGDLKRGFMAYAREKDGVC